MGTKTLWNYLKLTGLCVLLSAFLSGCLSSFGAKLQEDASLPQIDSINTLADVSSVGFEWKFLDNEHIKGFVIYRAQAKDNQKLQKIATIPNRFATHFYDINLNPQTKYIYEIGRAHV